jgi:hypothetical protein
VSDSKRLQGAATISIVEAKPPEAGWSAQDREGIGQSFTLRPVWAVSSSETAGNNDVETLRNCSDGSGLAFFAINGGTAFSSLQHVRWHDQDGGNEPVLNLETGFEVNSLVLAGSGETLLVISQPKQEDRSLNTFDKNKTSHQLGTGFVAWRPSSRLGVGAGRDFSRNFAFVRVEEGITSAAFSLMAAGFFLVTAPALPVVSCCHLHQVRQASCKSCLCHCLLLGLRSQWSMSSGTALQYAPGMRMDAYVCGMWPLMPRLRTSLPAQSLRKTQTFLPRIPCRLPCWKLLTVWRHHGLLRLSPPAWVIALLEASSGLAVTSGSEGWNLRAIPCADMKQRMTEVVRMAVSDNPWDVWTRWLQGDQLRRPVYPGLQTMEALFPLREMVPSFEVSSGRIRPPSVAILKHRPGHWLYPFVQACQKTAVTSKVTADVPLLIKEGMQRIDQLPSEERSVCWAAVACMETG